MTEEHSSSNPFSYERTIMYLAAITIVEFIVSSNDLRFDGTGIILIALAIVKAVLVAAIFMHVKFEKNPKFLVFWVFAVPLIAGSILIFTLIKDWRGANVVA